MGTLLEMGMLESVISPWAAANVLVLKHYNGVRVTSYFLSPNQLTVTDAYFMEDVRHTQE